MFLINMDSTSTKLKEILILNRQLRNALSFRGGARKLNNFKDKLIENKVQIFYLYIISFFTILYLCSINLPQNKKFIGGAPEDKGFFQTLSGVIKVLNDSIYKIIDKLYQLIKPSINKLSNVISDKVDMIHDRLLESGQKLSSNIDDINEALDSMYTEIFITLFIKPIIVIPPLLMAIPPMPLFITIVIIIYLLCNFILDSKLYFPCYGCEKGNSFYNCMPGTGYGSIGCTIYTEFLNKIKLIIKQIKNVSEFVKVIKKGINQVLYSVLYLVKNISEWFYEVFGTPVDKVLAALKFLKRLEVPDNWGFNFGEFLICPDFSTRGKNCIYNKDGSLRNRHGNNPIFHTFWKMIRVILEIPPDIPKFPFSGGAKLKLNNINIPTVTQPSIEKQEIDVSVNTKSNKPPYDKDIAYKKLLETLIKIEINPIKWIAALFNLLIDAINAIMDQYINALKIIFTFIFELITLVVKGLTKALGKIVSELLKPLNDVADIAIKIPKQLFKSITKILDIGIYPIITHFFYEMLIKLFPFLNRLKSFIIIIAIVILIQGVLIYCHIIGGLYAFYTPIMYAYHIYNIVQRYIQNYNKIFDDLQYYLIDNNPLIQKIKEYILDMKELHRIVSLIVITIIIIFIILNYFVNVNKYLANTIYNIVYGHYYNKFDLIRKQYMRFKLAKLEREKEQIKLVENNNNSNNTTTFNRLLNLTTINTQDITEDITEDLNSISYLNNLDNLQSLNYDTLKNLY